MTRKAQAKKTGPTFLALWAVRRAVGVFTPAERLCLYGIVASMDETGESSPGHSGISDGTSLDVRSVRRVMPGLLARGVVVCVTQETPRSSAVYRLDLGAMEAATEAAENQERPSRRRRERTSCPPMGGQAVPSERTPDPLSEQKRADKLSPGGRTGGPLREDTVPPIEDLFEDQEDLGGAVPDAARVPTTVRTFVLEPPAPKKRHRTKEKSKAVDAAPKEMSKAERFRGYVAAFQNGFSRGVGQVVSLEGIRGPDHVLVRCCKTHAKSPTDGSELRGPDLLAWLESKAEEFGKRFGNVAFAYHKFNDWLNGSTSNQATVQKPIGAQPAGKNQDASWKAGLSMSDEDRKNLGEKAKVINL